MTKNSIAKYISLILIKLSKKVFKKYKTKKRILLINNIKSESKLVSEIHLVRVKLIMRFRILPNTTDIHLKIYKWQWKIKAGYLVNY